MKPFLLRFEDGCCTVVHNANVLYSCAEALDSDHSAPSSPLTTSLCGSFAVLKMRNKFTFVVVVGD